MRKLLAIILALAGLGLGWPGRAGAAMIADLTVEGNQRIEAEVVLNTTGLLPGDQLDEKNLAEAVKRIYQLGYFSQVAVLGEAEGDKLRLIFAVEEKPLVERVELIGNKKLKAGDLEPKLAVRAGGMLDPFSLRQSADSIRAAYAEKGYFSAQISDSLIESGDKYAVRFIIEEGRKIRVKDILVSGNQAAKRGEIIGAMKKTKPRGWTLVWKAIPWWRSGDRKSVV